MNIIDRIKHWMIDPDPWDDDDYDPLISPTGDDGDSVTDIAPITGFDEPMFIHAHTLTFAWRDATGAGGCEMTDRVIRVTGTSPYSPDPITVDVGVRGTGLHALAMHLHESSDYWHRAYREIDAERYRVWVEGGGGG